jgi:hypothetical protein
MNFAWIDRPFYDFAGLDLDCYHSDLSFDSLAINKISIVSDTSCQVCLEIE